MEDQIGSSAEAAANCFSELGVDILIQDSGNISTSPFSYFYFDDSDEIAQCQEPIDLDVDFKAEILNLGNYCDGNIGVFGLIDPDGDGDNGIIPGTDNPNQACKPCIKDSIYQWINNTVLTDGDNPTTFVDESDGKPTTSEQLQSEAILDQWIHYALYVALSTNDYAFAESVLIPLNKYRWQKRLYGIYISQDRYNQAKSLLLSLPSRSSNEQYFKEVQLINLKKLENRIDEISQSEIDLLETIALSIEPSSCYARSLYYFLTDIRLTLEIPDLRNYSSNRESSPKTKKVEPISIYPNPVRDLLIIDLTQIKIKSTFTNIALIDMHGKTFLEKETKDQTINLNVSMYNSGIYFLKIFTNKEERVFKIIITD
jgi:hypothetical protein